MDKYSALFVEYLSGYGIKPKTIRRMKYQIKKFYNWLANQDIRDIKEIDLIDFAKYLYSTKTQYGKPFSPRSIECLLSGIKSYFGFLFQIEYILTNPAENLRIK